MHLRRNSYLAGSGLTSSSAISSCRKPAACNWWKSSGEFAPICRCCTCPATRTRPWTPRSWHQTVRSSRNHSHRKVWRAMFERRLTPSRPGEGRPHRAQPLVIRQLQVTERASHRLLVDHKLECPIVYHTDRTRRTRIEEHYLQ